MMRSVLPGLILTLCLPGGLSAQNVIDRAGLAETAPLRPVSAEEISHLIDHTLAFKGTAENETARLLTARLTRAVREYLTGSPWRPWVHTLGISGQELHFDRPAEILSALAASWPGLPEDLRPTVQNHLADLARRYPPGSLRGPNRRAGKPRELYDVPERLIPPGAASESNGYTFYAFWRAVHLTGQRELAIDLAPALRTGAGPLLQKNFTFDPLRRHEREEARHLNGDLSGLLGLVRLARLMGDADLEKQATGQFSRAIQIRAHLEQVNPEILEPGGPASAGLHQANLSRYLDLAPEIALQLNPWTGGVAARRLEAFRTARPGWFLSQGPRLAGGENLTSSARLPRALFEMAALVEKRPFEELALWTDQPWCLADLHWIEKLALSLWAAQGGGTEPIR